MHAQLCVDPERGCLPSPEEMKGRIRTKVVKDNGFNPQWNESFKFKSIFPGLAILCFVVMDDDTLSDDFIEQYSLPLESLARGYRYVHVLSPLGEKLEQCTIFVHVKIENAADVVYEMKTVSDPGVPIEECLHVLTWQGVVVEASGNVFVTHSDKMDNLVVKGIAIVFNNMNSVFASTMKDGDQLLAALKEAHESCKGEYKHVQEGLQKVESKRALQLAVSYTRNMRTLYGLIASLQEQKAAVQRDLAVIHKYAAEMAAVPGEAADL